MGSNHKIYDVKSKSKEQLYVKDYVVYESCITTSETQMQVAENTINKSTGNIESDINASAVNNKRINKKENDHYHWRLPP